MSLASPQPRRPGSPRLCGRPTASQSGRPGRAAPAWPRCAGTLPRFLRRSCGNRARPASPAAQTGRLPEAPAALFTPARAHSCRCPPSSPSPRSAASSQSSRAAAAPRARLRPRGESRSQVCRGLRRRIPGARRSTAWDAQHGELCPSPWRVAQARVEEAGHPYKTQAGRLLKAGRLMEAY